MSRPALCGGLLSQLLIKCLLLGGIALVAALAFRGSRSARSLALWRAGGALVVLLASLSVIFPDALTAVAHLVGVARGTDLLLYVLVISFMLVEVTIFRKMAEMRQRITLLVRHLALLEARLSNPDGASQERDQ